MSTDGREQLKAMADSLPRTGELTPLDDKAALALMHDLKVSGSGIPAGISPIVDKLQATSITELEQVPDKPGIYVISEQELRGTLARAAIAGSAATVYALAESSKTVSELSKVLDIPSKDNKKGNSAA